MTLLYGPLLKVVVFSVILLFRTVTTFNTTTAVNDTFCQGPTSLSRLLLCGRSMDRKDCPVGKYSATNGACRNCHLYGDPCVLTTQCCQTEHMICWNFSSLALPSCLCENGYNWDADAIRCYLPVTLPQQLLLIAAYSILGVMITVGVTATLIHVFGKRCGLCQRRKSHSSEEEPGDLDFLREPDTSDRELPPPYTPLEPPDTQFSPQAATNSAMHAGLGLALPITGSHVGLGLALPITVSHRPIQNNPAEPPPAYDVIAQSLVIHVHPTSDTFQRSVSFRRDSLFSTTSFTPAMTSSATIDENNTIAEDVNERSTTPPNSHPKPPIPPNTTPPAASTSENITSDQATPTIVTSSSSPVTSSDDLQVQSVVPNSSKPTRKVSSAPSRKLSNIYEVSPPGLTSSAPDLSTLSDDPESRPRVKFDYAKFAGFQKSNMSANFQPSIDLSSLTSPAACRL